MIIDLFHGFMMPHPMHMAPPPSMFSSGFMSPSFGFGGHSLLDSFMSPNMLGPFQQRQQQAFQSNGNNRGYSRSVSTCTRTINGVTETVKVTKITDENVRQSVWSILDTYTYRARAQK
jgi:hypothetical protein